MVAELDNREEKNKVIWRKKGLERGIYIEDDLTKEERERKQRLRERLEESRKDRIERIESGKLEKKEDDDGKDGRENREGDRRRWEEQGE